MANRDVKVCVLGDSGVGKTCIVNRFVRDSFTATEPTIGAAFMTQILSIDGENYRFQIWDTAGQERYRSLAPMYYRGALAAIIVYEINREETFLTVQHWVNELRRYGPPDIITILAGNKVDLEMERDISHEEAERFAQNNGAILFEVSAKTGFNIPQIFSAIARRLPPVEYGPGFLTRQYSRIKIEEETPKKKKKCCS